MSDDELMERQCAKGRTHGTHEWEHVERDQFEPSGYRRTPYACLGRVRYQEPSRGQNFCVDCGCLVHRLFRETHDDHHDRLDKIAEDAQEGAHASSMLGPIG